MLPFAKLQASGRRKLGEFKINNDNYNQEVEVANDKPNSFNPMSQMNAVLYHNKSASRRVPEQTDLLPSEESGDKQDAKRIYRVSRANLLFNSEST